ncbi:MAG: hypothetical protein Q4G68_07215 [Planctomycetia bacterium]|nr:hypothetical protein [Planctomycetia bacterium]
MKKTTLILLFVACVLLCFSGCDERKPGDMPKLTPVTLIFTQKGEPLVEAEVSLQMVEKTTSFGAGGVTNASGAVDLLTHGRYSGVPEGEYVVLVSKFEEIKEGPWDQVPTDPAQERAFLAKNAGKLKRGFFQMVDSKYMDPKTSDLRLSVGRSRVKQTFELGAPAREKAQRGVK